MTVVLRKRKLKSGNVQLFLDISKGVAGTKRIREALGLFLTGDRFQDKETKRMAEIIRADRERELLHEEHGLADRNKRRASFVDYYQKLTATKNAKNTRVSWSQALDHLTAFLGESTTFADLTRDRLEQFKERLLSTVSPNTTQIYLARIKTALSQAVKDGILPSNPATFVTVRHQKKLPVFLTLAEVRALAKTKISNANIKNAFLFSCFSGLRYSDLLSLTWNQIQDGYLTFSQIKTDRPERMPLSGTAKDILRKQKRLTGDGPRVFALPRQSTIDKAIKKWAKDAGIKKNLSIHKARHTFATLTLSSGVDIYTTSKLLGHKNLQTTQIYAQVIDESKKQAVDKLPKL